ncbi:colicin immunity domain-containing protein [Sphingomonas sp. NCPPB 2930]
MTDKTTNLAEIRNLISKFLQHQISVQEFCDTFETIWNFNFDKKQIDIEKFEGLDFLFDEVVLFCPAPRTQWEYPKYRDEYEIRAASEKIFRLID